MIHELETVLKEEVVAYFKLGYYPHIRRADENHEGPRSG
jgi:hypothetical protein